MTMHISTPKCWLVATLVVPITAHAGGGGFGGATEVTQLLNHAELIASVANEAQVVTNTLNQYAAMIQNLKQIPSQLIGTVTMPWQQLSMTYTSLAGAVSNVQSAFSSAYQLLQYRQGQANALGMSPLNYLNAEIQLAQTKGGAYQDQIQRDMQTLQSASVQAQNLVSLANQVPAISGSVQGLQHLATTSSMIGGVLMDLRGIALQQQINTANQRVDEARNEQATSGITQQMLREANQQAAGTALSAPGFNLQPDH
ncbi:conjugal transfer protein TrbJ [Burkholderia glumae]|uniref:conjugal transfer protein TrbJ n=1 Tax=Burkholderia glumae TaxID=337 RepID=UPI00203706CA|nr:conjugal transfer protein TrbJ [Burkholderia glumae]MCM2552659.1 conjugal transfer protein TrbJ [Burkholderia glumae]